MNNEITFLANDRLLKRLNAYYAKKGFNELPVSIKLTPEERILKIGSLGLIDGEFLITQFKLRGHDDILVTSRKIAYFLNEKLIEVFPFEEITSLYLNANFKVTSPKVLHIKLRSSLRQLEFEDNIELSDARNEIYHIINNAIINWQGRDFLISEND